VRNSIISQEKSDKDIIRKREEEDRSFWEQQGERL